MRTRAALVSFLILMTGACSRSKSAAPADASTTAPTCDRRLAVVAHVVGTWRGDATDETSASPRLVVELEDAAHSQNEYAMIPLPGAPNERRIATIALAAPFFAAPVGPEDLCGGMGEKGGLSIRCVGERGAMTRVQVKNDGHGLSVSIDDAPAQAWPMPA